MSRRIHPIVAQLRDARIAAGLTQGAVAHRLGTNRQALRRWEVGRTEPLLCRVNDWAAALGYQITLTPEDPEG